MRVTGRAVWEIGSTAIVVVAAVTMATFYLVDRGRSQPQGSSAVEEVETWRDWAESAVYIGPRDAAMVVAVFMDFQCPFCRNLVPVFDSLRADYGDVVAIEFHHFTLPNHPYSLPAAIAAECADRQGRFEEMYGIIFAQVDSLEERSWESLAADAGIPFLEEFNGCTLLPWQEFPRIAEGKALGLSVGVEGTPTVWINGHLFSGRTLEAFRERAEDLGLR